MPFDSSPEGVIPHYYGCGDSLVRRSALPDRFAPFSAIHQYFLDQLMESIGVVINMISANMRTEELLQQSFVKLHHARAAYVRGADPIPWLYTIAHRTCIDEIRRTRRAHVSVLAADRPLPEIAARIDGHREGDDAVYGEELIARVLDAVEELPENQRLAVVLTKIHGKSVAEAAEILGTTPGAVKLRAHRGYVALRELLRAFTGDFLTPLEEP